MRSELVIRIALHATIIFSFITIFFFLYIAEKWHDSVVKSLKNLIDTNMKNILNEIDEQLPVDWDYVSSFAQEQREQLQMHIAESNRKLKIQSVITVWFLFVSTVSIFIYYHSNITPHIRLSVIKILIALIITSFYYYIAIHNFGVHNKVIDRKFIQILKSKLD